MDKYNISIFKKLLAEDLSEEEKNLLFKDPVFEQEFTFYLQMKQAGNQLINKYSTVDTTLKVDYKTKTQYIFSGLTFFTSFGRVASVAILLFGIYLLLPTKDPMMGGNESTFLAEYGLGLGLGLIVFGVFGVFYLKKK